MGLALARYVYVYTIKYKYAYITPKYDNSMIGSISKLLSCI